MSIIIYTYRDPYKLNLEAYWDEIKCCPFFCASQTLVNGLKSLYPREFVQGRVTTVQYLVDALFPQWQSTAYLVKQHTEIDNIISRGLHSALPVPVQDHLSSAFLFNREEVLKSIRTMFELNLTAEDIDMEQLNSEQYFILELFKALQTAKKNHFVINDIPNVGVIDSAINAVMLKASHDEIDLNSVECDRIVIHGVHQFSPIILRAIEEISKYKKVILLFNYQSQYKNAYQTWVNIYSTFDCPILPSQGVEFHPTPALPVSYQSNQLADQMGKLLNGDVDHIISGNMCEILEFDNMMEFASYVADIFKAAEHLNKDQAMKNMSEQIYAADSSVNNILKMYFPEQFGERQFLNYPLGHFFLGVANMWDPDSNELVIRDTRDIKECLEAGILKESFLGELASIFNKVESLFEGCTTIDEMTVRIKKIRRHQKHLSSPEKRERVSHIAYYTVSKEDLQKLEQALQELNELAAYFYEDFENHSNNFREFYQRLKQYLQEDILETHDLGEEFSDIIRRVLERLEEVDSIDASASFECLKSTMSIYLVQKTKPGKSANWIVRGFEQIDGDILRSRNKTVNNEPVIYHFACLSDEDINAVQTREFPWPLDDSFFEIAQEPIDWKCQVYVKSRKEYKNFKRYALLYGLEFNRSKFKLSYIKRDGERERDPYYLLKILGINKIKYEESKIGSYLTVPKDINTTGTPMETYNEYDYYRYRICKYRFLLESICEGTTVYKDPFLLIKYLEVLLENQVREELQGMAMSAAILNTSLDSAFEDLKKYFPFIQNMNRLDIVHNIQTRILDSKLKTFPILSSADRQYMMIRELFIHKKLFDPKAMQRNVLQDKFPPVTGEKIEQTLSASALEGLKFSKETDVWCQYCSNREFCVSYYTQSTSI